MNTFSKRRTTTDATSRSVQLRANVKEKLVDKEFYAETRDADLSQRQLERIYAVDQVFVKVSFSQSVLTSCYFRKCRFIECDFTGATMINCNFKGASFDGCTFKYTSWERTLLEDGFLDICLPSEENLARDLVRSLRVNFAEVGNYEAVNRAASIEVKLTGQHLQNAAFSNQSYYRAKYKGWNRVLQVGAYLNWRALDLLWGNGESLSRVVASGGVVVTLVAVWYIFSKPEIGFTHALLAALAHFFGVEHQPAMSPVLSILLTAVRFVLFGLFMAILIKRLSRR